MRDTLTRIFQMSYRTSQYCLEPRCVVEKAFFLQFRAWEPIFDIRKKIWEAEAAGLIFAGLPFL